MTHRMPFAISLVLGLGAWVTPVATSAAGDVPVLDDRTLWRLYVVLRPPVEGTARNDPAENRIKTDWITGGEQLASPLPEAGWIDPEYDDAGWQRRRGPFFGGYGNVRPAGVALLCLRGRFGVTEPSRAEGLKLGLAYRGGVAVYLNGHEVFRGHLPSGELEPLALAEDYPREVFVTPGGEALLPNYGAAEPPQEVLARYQRRIRRTSVNLPPRLLRKGANLLAIEVHRTAIPARLPRFGRGAWDTAGLCKVSLTAPAGSPVEANVGPASGVQVWKVAPWQRVDPQTDYGDPFRPPDTIRMAAPANGFASAQLAVGASEEFSGLSTTLSDLRSAGGARLPSSTIRVRYADVRQQFIPLLDKPLGSARIQPLWLTAGVPADARPGKYTGKLTVNASGQSSTIPVELTVFGWQLGDPADWKTCVNLLQSPESVAGYYKVPLWSDRHFRLLESSFRLMGLMGNDVLGISAVAKSVFGDDPVIVFRRQARQYVPELKYLRRYLELYEKHAGEPQFLSLNVWSYGMYERGAGRDGGSAKRRASVVPVVELREDGLLPLELPIYGRPGTEELWRGVIDGLRGCVRDLGWREECILLGTSGDTWPSPATVRMFEKAAPGAQWRALTHGGGVPRWGISDHERRQPNGMVVGYLEIARRLVNHRVKRPHCPVTCNARDKVGADPFTYLGLAMTNTIATNYDGYCWKGLDYWTYTAPDGTKRNALNTYVHFGNMVGGTPRAIAFPGPHGALATVQFEMLREGTQYCEAVLSIRQNLEILEPPAVKRYDVARLTLKDALVRDESRGRESSPRLEPKDLDLTLIYEGQEATPVEIRPRAPTYNKGEHRCRFQVAAGDAGQQFDLEIVLGDDPWVKGGRGTYAVELSREGDSYAGRFRGSYNGIRREGPVSGVFVPQGLTVPVKNPAPRSPLAKRCDALIEELSGRLARRSASGDLEGLVSRLYATATEVAEAASAKSPADGKR